MSERRVTRWASCFLLVVCAVVVGCGRGSAPINASKVLVQKDVPKLLENLASKHAGTRGQAAKYLGNLGAEGELGADSANVLAKLQEVAKNDPNPVVKKNAEEAVAKVQSGG